MNNSGICHRMLFLWYYSFIGNFNIASIVFPIVQLIISIIISFVFNNPFELTFQCLKKWKIFLRYNFWMNAVAAGDVDDTPAVLCGVVGQQSSTILLIVCFSNK